MRMKSKSVGAGHAPVGDAVLGTVGAVLTGGRGSSPQHNGPADDGASASVESSETGRALLGMARGRSLFAHDISRPMRLIDISFGGTPVQDGAASGLAGNHTGCRRNGCAAADDHNLLGVREVPVSWVHRRGVTHAPLAPRPRPCARSRHDVLAKRLIYPEVRLVGLRRHQERPGVSRLSDRRLLARRVGPVAGQEAQRP